MSQGTVGVEQHVDTLVATHIADEQEVRIVGERAHEVGGDWCVRCIGNEVWHDDVGKPRFHEPVSGCRGCAHGKEPIHERGLGSCTGTMSEGDRRSFRPTVMLPGALETLGEARSGARRPVVHQVLLGAREREVMQAHDQRGTIASLQR